MKNYRITPLNRARRALAGIAVSILAAAGVVALAAVAAYTAAHLFN